jgi:hypothetical protein
MSSARERYVLIVLAERRKRESVGVLLVTMTAQKQSTQQGTLRQSRYSRQYGSVTSHVTSEQSDVRVGSMCISMRLHKREEGASTNLTRIPCSYNQPETFTDLGHQSINQSRWRLEESTLPRRPHSTKMRSAQSPSRTSRPRCLCSFTRSYLKNGRSKY